MTAIYVYFGVRVCDAQPHMTFALSLVRCELAKPNNIRLRF